MSGDLPCSLHSFFLFGTYQGGLVGWQLRRFQTYTVEDELPHDTVWSVFSGGDGSVWIGTESGLSQFKNGKFTAFKHDERRRNIIRCFSEDANGDLWVGSLGGGVLRFRYTAPSLIAPERVRFKHRLEGHNSDWIDVGTERAAYYTNLRPGDYRFQVIACNHHGFWNETGATFAFMVAPFYWETATFRVAVALIVVLTGSAAAWCLYRWRLSFVGRIHELEKKEALAQERKRIARDLHDQIGSQLTDLSHPQPLHPAGSSANKFSSQVIAAERAQT